MSARLRQEHGFTLVELLLVCALSIVIMGATLSAFTSLYGANRRAEVQHDHVEAGRAAVDRATRQLRNLANPTYNATTTIARADDLDFIFQTSDPEKIWIRYCLDTSTPPATAGDARLWVGESPSSTLQAGMTEGCPGTGWSTRRVVAEHVTNQAGVDRNLFTFECAPRLPLGCPAGSAGLPKITSVALTLWIDADHADRTKEIEVSSAVYLRNQNEAPTAAVAPPVRKAPRVATLSAAGSSDPEGRTLQYYWFKDVAPVSSELANCGVKPPSAIWEGVTLTYEFPASDGVPGTVKPFWLVVRDPGCLTDTAGPVEVSIPS